MIQRVQSLYLLAGAILSIVCVVCLWGLWLPMALLVVSALFGIYTIFVYNNRKLQAKFCMFNIMLLVGWYILYFVMYQFFGATAQWPVALPLLSLLCYVLARRGIMADERLVRAADRIR